MKSTFEQFRCRRDLWINCLDGEDFHSIIHQIGRMIWNTAAYRVVNEARRIAPPAKEGGVQLNGLMHRLIDDGFFEGQSLAIRRLIDDYPITSDGHRNDVFSLVSLLKDMKKYVFLFTRQNMLAAEGKDYDYLPILERARAYNREREIAGDHSYVLPQVLNWRGIERRHEQIDFLAGVTEKSRSPMDAVRSLVLDLLIEKITTASQDLQVHVNKFVAHAASPESRQLVSADSFEITLNHLYVAHEAICKVASFVDVYLLRGCSHNHLAIPQYNQFVYMDRPLVTKEGVSALQGVWNDYDRETNRWSNWSIDTFRQEFNL